MQQFTELLDEKTVSLDEILAFVDSTDFDLPMAELHDSQEDPAGFFDRSMDIEDSLVLSQECNPDSAKESKPSVTQQIRITTTPGEDVNWAGRSAPSRKPPQERGRVRDRVIRFGGIVKRLEQQLEEINNLRVLYVDGEDKEQFNSLDESQNSAMNEGVDTNAVTWHEIATRQFAARRETEKENLSLRERLENLIRGHQIPYGS